MISVFKQPKPVDVDHVHIEFATGFLHFAFRPMNHWNKRDFEFGMKGPDFLFNCRWFELVCICHD